MDSPDAVEAFARASQPHGILAGVYAFILEHSCRMIQPGSRVLDLGTGPASLLCTLAQANPDSAFIGIDLSESMVSVAQKQIHEMNLRNATVRVDDITSLSTVADQSVDIVLSSMAFHHLRTRRDLSNTFKQIDRILSPDGRVFICDFGRIKSLVSVEYFVRRAIPPEEVLLERDYRASLRAAFSLSEFAESLPPRLERLLQLNSTAVSPLLIVIRSEFPTQSGVQSPVVARMISSLPPRRLSDFRQLQWFFRLGGMPWR